MICSKLIIPKCEESDHIIKTQRVKCRISEKTKKHIKDAREVMGFH